MGQSRNWTKEETEYLCDKWGTISLSHIADKLNRTPTAIKIRVQRLGLGAFLENGEYVSWHQLLIALGITGGTGYKTKSWIENRNFPIKTKRVENNTFKVVYLDDFWNWAYKNQTFIDFSKFEENSLGQEPDWVKHKRKNDRRLKQDYKSTPWTKLEDKKLYKLLKDYKYSYSDLSKELNRTCGAIQRRILDLGFKERPLKADNHTQWIDAELTILADLIKSGHKYEYIAEHLIGKSTKAIRGKVYSMYLTENLDKVRSLIGNGNWGDGRPERKVSQYLLMSVPEKEETKEKVSMLAYILLQRAKQLSPVSEEFKEFWQKDLCQNWDDVKGCIYKDGCDTCPNFIRVKEQYCRRCGATVLNRKPITICPRCAEQRKKQAQKKWATMNSKGGAKNAL